MECGFGAWLVLIVVVFIPYSSHNFISFTYNYKFFVFEGFLFVCFVIIAAIKQVFFFSQFKFKILELGNVGFNI